MRGLTPQLVPVLAHVLGEPEDQVSDGMKEKLVELVKYLHSKQSSIVEGHPTLQALV